MNNKYTRIVVTSLEVTREKTSVEFSVPEYNLSNCTKTYKHAVLSIDELLCELYMMFNFDFTPDAI